VGAPVLFALIALVLGLFGLSDKGLWLDEAVSLRFALSPPVSWFADNNMALFYALLSLVVKLFGDSERALRGLSVLSFALAAPLFHAFLRRAFDARVAHIGCALFVANAYLVHFAQEARGYMLALLLCVAASLSLLRLSETRATSWALAYGMAIGLALYAHAFALWLLLAHALCALWYVLRERAALWPLARGFALAGLFAAPLVFNALSAGTGQIGWIKRPSVESCVAMFALFAGGSALLAGALLALFVASSLRASRGSPTAAFARLLCAGWFLVPVVCTLAISIVFTPLVHPKYLLISLPGLFAGAALAIAELPRAPLRYAVSGALVCASLAGLYDYYAHYERERWRELVAYLVRNARPGDGLVLDLSAPEALDYYVLRAGRGRPALPPPIYPDRPWSITWPELREHDAREERARLAAHARIWLIENRSPDSDLRARLTRTHASTARLTFEPKDGDERSLFANSAGRIIQLELLERASSRR
jgi:mannosyltransferase